MQINIGQNQINLTQEVRQATAIDPAAVDPQAQLIRFRQRLDGPGLSLTSRVDRLNGLSASGITAAAAPGCPPLHVWQR